MHVQFSNSRWSPKSEFRIRFWPCWSLHSLECSCYYRSQGSKYFFFW